MQIFEAELMEEFVAALSVLASAAFDDAGEHANVPRLLDIVHASKHLDE